MNIFLADMGDFGAVNEIYEGVFSGVEPKPVCLLFSRWVGVCLLIRDGRSGHVWRLRRCRWERMWRLSVRGWLVRGELDCDYFSRR